VKTFLLFMIVLLLLIFSHSAQGGNIRSILIHGDICYAAGDGGLALRSDDAGRTWKPLTTGSTASFHALVADADNAAVLYFIGGRGVAGLPSRGGQGVVLKTPDGGETFEPLATAALPCLYGGFVKGRIGMFIGQGTSRSSGGLWRTGDGGRTFVPDTSLPSAGYLLAGRWLSPGAALLVGANDTLVEIREVGGPVPRTPAMPRARALRAVGSLDDGTFFAAGSGGSLYRARLGQPVPTPIAPDLPAGSVLLADFQSLCAAGDNIFVVGGLWGNLLHSADAGRRWQIRPTPRGGGELHAVAAGNDFLLVGGSSGRIWRSDDNATTWTLVAGREKTDVMFVMAAQDVSLLPMIVAHVLAGDEVAVVVATTPVDRLNPPGQHLVLALSEAGVAGVTVLDDFACHCDVDDDTTTAEHILQTWSDTLDVPAEPVLKRQLAAAIRLYQPAVLCVGPSEPGRAGFYGENRLIARLALEAAEIAAMEPATPTTAPAPRTAATAPAPPPPGSPAAVAASLDRLQLPPWTCQRVWRGADENEFVTLPAQRQPLPDRKTRHAILDAATFWQDQPQTIELLAARAAWIACPTFLPRPPRYTAYLSSEEKYRSMLTAGISEAYYQPRETTPLERDLAAGNSVQFALATRGKATVVTRLADDVKRAGDNTELVTLAADRMLLVWQALLADGDLMNAEQTRAEFLRVGVNHPLHGRVLGADLTVLFSRQWQAQMTRRGPRWSQPDPADAAAAIAAARERPLWFDDPSFQLAAARALNKSGKPLEARQAIQRIADGPVGQTWKDYLELDLTGLPSANTRQIIVPASRTVTEPLRTPWGERLEGEWAAATLQAGRGAGNTLRLAVTLPQRAGRQWTLDVAVDSDRDTQLIAVLRTDMQERKTFRLEGPLLPPVHLNAKPIGLRCAQDEDKATCTFEITLPLEELGLAPDVATLCGFTLRATARDGESATTLVFQPNEGTTIRGERLGVLILEPVRR